jgi:iron complex outermembrane receptor protein
MRTPSRARLLAGAALIAICGATPALAQSAQDPQDATEVEEIVITGIAASLETAIAEKRSATSIVEVIAAEDLGKLPDQSIAESLARLPGLAAQRVDGRAQVISIRGLGPDFTTALLNGREQVTTGDNRGVEFDQFPSELLSGVIVYKTPDAALAAQGLAGTADLQTVRPLEYGRRAGAINYRYEWNDLGSLNAGAEDTGHRFSASFVDQFMDDTVGIALGVAYMETPYQNERYNAWGYPTVDAGPGYISASPAAYAGAIGAEILGGAKPYAQSGLIERTGYMGVLEWAPNDRFRATADVFYSEFENTQILRGIEIPLWWGDSSREQLQPNYTVTDGLITQATFNGVRGVVRNDLNTREAETTSLGLRLEYDLTDNWAVSLDVNSSAVDRTDQVIESYSGYGYNFAGARDNITYTLDSRGVASFSTNLDYTDPTQMVLTDPRGWGGSQIQAGYLNSPITEDELNAVRLATTYTFDSGLIRSIEAGVNVTSRDKSFVSDEFFLIPSGGATSRPIPSDCLLDPTSIGFLGFSMISYDTQCVLNSGALAQQRNANFDVVSKNWEVSEDIINVFVKANLEGNLGPIPFTGNAGLQMIDVDQSSNGFAATSQINGVSTPVSGGAEYRDFLPSLNLIFELTPSDVLRFATARVQARPRMDQMRASRTYGFNEQNRNSTNINAAYFNGGGGNPELRPWQADILDVSYEHYFTPRSYVSVAGFYKDLKTYIYNQNVVQDFSGLNYPTAAGQGVPASFFGLYNSPQNGTGGTIEGIELAASLALGDFIAPLEGFGVVASWADTSSDIQPEPGNPSRPIEGLSEQVSNVTVYYERNGFQARVSNRYRSEFLGEVAGFGNGRTFRTVGEESIIDAQIGYEFQSGPLEGLSVLLQGNNLTDEEFVTLNNNLETQPIDYQVYGSTYLIGINYRF